MHSAIKSREIIKRKPCVQKGRKAVGVRGAGSVTRGLFELFVHQSKRMRLLVLLHILLQEINI